MGKGTRGFVSILLVTIFVLFGITTLGYIIYTKTPIKIPNIQPSSQQNIQNCGVCYGNNDTSCTGGKTCFVPTGLDSGYCVPNPKPGQVYTNEQIEKICGVTLPPSATYPTTDWNIYTNTVDKYELKYPKTWYLKEPVIYSFGQNYSTIGELNKILNNTPNPLIIRFDKIQLNEEEKQLTPQDKQKSWLEWINSKIKSLDVKIQNEEKSYIGGRESVIYTLCLESNRAIYPKYPCSEEIFIPNENFLINITIDGDTNQQEIIHQILSTFRFTDSENKNPKTFCESYLGIWLEEYNECEIGTSPLKMNPEQCKGIGGTYKSCESPCRHDPSIQKCITVCVEVCSF